MSSPDSSSNDLPLTTHARGREGVDPHEILEMPARILQALTALVDGHNAQRNSAEGISRRLANVERSVQELVVLYRDALARPAGTTTAAEEPSRQALQVEREMMWNWEVGRDGSQALRLPRPSIIGRALYDLQREAGSAYDGSSPADIYITISDRGQHHLSEVARYRVERYKEGDTQKMAGKLNEHLESRFDALSDRTRGRSYAENIRDRRSLTAHGGRIFADWPHWSARDNDVTGDGSGPSGSAPPVGGAGLT